MIEYAANLKPLARRATADDLPYALMCVRHCMYDEASTDSEVLSGLTAGRLEAFILEDADQSKRACIVVEMTGEHCFVIALWRTSDDVRALKSDVTALFGLVKRVMDRRGVRKWSAYLHHKNERALALQRFFSRFGFRPTATLVEMSA
jgi:hypothetical protein